MKKPKKSTIKRKADALFSQHIRSQGYCDWCRKQGTPDDFECAHIFSRRYLITRWELMNSLCLCHACHRRAHDQPVEFTEFVREYLGTDIYNELRYMAKTRVNKNVYDGLIERIKNYEIDN